MLAQRIASGAILVPVLLAIIVIGEPVLAVALTIVAFVAGGEVSSLLERAGFRNARLLAPALAAVVVFTTWLLPDKAIAFAAAAIVFAALVAFAEPDVNQAFRIWLATSFAATYVALLSFVVLIAGRAPALQTGAPISAYLDAGRTWVLILVLGVWAFDTGAYAVGRAIGKRKLIPHVSPGKTWEGAFGGVVAAIIVSYVTSWAAGVPSGPAAAVAPLVLGALIAIAAQTGDLAESMLKRAAGAVESGNLIPGHGGLLDRIDSFLFAAPAVYLYMVTVAGR